MTTDSAAVTVVLSVCSELLSLSFLKNNISEFECDLGCVCL